MHGCSSNRATCKLGEQFMKRLAYAKRIVIKIGTNTLMKGDKVSAAVIDSLARQISGEVEKGKEIILVTSGAVGFGSEKLGIMPKNLSVSQQQAAAAVGQGLLMSEYEKAFSKRKQPIAQILLTSYNFQNKASLADLKNTISELMKMKVVPIINENDPVSIEELDVEGKFDDNDGLAALSAIEFGAGLIVLFTDVGGIYDKNPREFKDAKIINGFSELQESEIHFGEKSYFGLGGAQAKVKAVKKVLSKGISAIVCRLEKGSLSKIFAGKAQGSVFLPKEK